MQSESEARENPRTDGEPSPTNEELAARVKAGDNGAAAQLWEQDQGLCSLLGWRLYSAYRERAEAAGVTMEDVQQISFPAILAAAQGYDPQAGVKFATYFPYHFRKEFRALVGLRTERQKQEPLCRACSLDAPIDAEDAESATRAELARFEADFGIWEGGEQQRQTAQHRKY